MSVFHISQYDEWVSTRTKKILSIIPAEFFMGKTVLDLACGIGCNGEKFSELGSLVTFADARAFHFDHLKKRLPDAECIVLDQETVWNLHRRFDAIIHWGILYHLENWKKDLECVTNHTDLIFLESEVSDTVEDCDVKVGENKEGTDQAFHGIGSRPSAFTIENHLTQLGFSFVRYDDSDINSYKHRYNWVVEGSGNHGPAYRRFWIARRK